MCEVICHGGVCPPCPLSELRHCPCGKTTHKVHILIAILNRDRTEPASRSLFKKKIKKKVYESDFIQMFSANAKGHPR